MVRAIKMLTIVLEQKENKMYDRYSSAGRFDHLHGDEESPETLDTVVSFPSYTQYIIDLISQLETEIDSESLIAATGEIEDDIHPKFGYVRSTKKTIVVTDVNNKSYLITVEEI